MTTPSDAQERLLPYLRHTATCELQEVRDNPPWDAYCTCGLREQYAALAAHPAAEEQPGE